jgi:hypothetical protein
MVVRNEPPSGRFTALFSTVSFLPLCSRVHLDGIYTAESLVGVLQRIVTPRTPQEHGLVLHI